MNHTNLHPEYLLTRHLNGVKLLRPSQCPQRLKNSVTNIGDLNNMPFNVFYMNHDHQILEANDATCTSVGFYERKDCYGTSVVDLCNDREQNNRILAHDNEVIQERNLKFYNETHELSNEISIQAISLKMPLYDENAKLAGVFGCSVIVDHNNSKKVSENISIISNLFLTDSIRHHVMPGQIINECYLTKRELDVAKWLLRGKTLKQTALILGLSPRTVENYFQTMKSKLNVRSKSEFLDKLFNLHT